MLPRDVIKKIVAKLDIDTRRSLGIYTRLSVPPQLVELFAAIPKPYRSVSYVGSTSDTCIVDLGMYSLNCTEIRSCCRIEIRHYVIKYNKEGECEFVQSIV